MKIIENIKWKGRQRWNESLQEHGRQMQRCDTYIESRARQHDSDESTTSQAARRSEDNK
jgi:hypothetical protein